MCTHTYQARNKQTWAMNKERGTKNVCGFLCSERKCMNILWGTSCEMFFTGTVNQNFCGWMDGISVATICGQISQFLMPPMPTASKGRRHTQRTYKEIMVPRPFTHICYRADCLKNRSEKDFFSLRIAAVSNGHTIHGERDFWVIFFVPYLFLNLM